MNDKLTTIIEQLKSLTLLEAAELVKEIVTRDVPKALKIAIVAQAYVESNNGESPLAKKGNFWGLGWRKELEELGESFVYTAQSSTTTFSTKAYILEVFRKGLEKNNFTNANLVFLLNETPYPAYYYEHKTNDFELVKEESK